MVKYLVTSGCSFSDNCGLRWPHYLSKKLNLILKNRGQGSAGNDYISKSVIHELCKLLKDDIKPSEILCIVMWSGLDRKSIFINKKETLNFDELLNNVDYNINPVNILKSLPNKQCAFGEDSGYLLGSMTCNFNNKNIKKFKKNYILNYYNDESLAIESYEHFLRVQWFCKSHNIKLINLTYMNIMHYPNYFINEKYNQNYKKTGLIFENVKHLDEMINYEDWIFYKDYFGLYEYTYDNKLSFGSDGLHPLEESHEYYVNNFLIKELKNKNFMEIE